MKHLLLFAVYCSLFIALSGCGQKLPDGLPPLLPCSIIVMQEGKPLPDAMISLAPQDGQWSANGISDSNGVAKMFTSGRYEGAVAGKYKVCILKTEFIAGKVSPDDIQPAIPDQSFALVEPQHSDQTNTPLVLDVSEETKEYKVDAGKAVRITLKVRD